MKKFLRETKDLPGNMKDHPNHIKYILSKIKDFFENTQEFLRIMRDPIRNM